MENTQASEIVGINSTSTSVDAGRLPVMTITQCCNVAARGVFAGNRPNREHGCHSQTRTESPSQHAAALAISRIEWSLSLEWHACLIFLPVIVT